jgi:excisionase family DNA binding protein
MSRKRTEAAKARQVTMRPGPVARLFRVDPKTAVRWAEDGKITTIRTPGGHHLFLTADILERLGPKVMSGEEVLMTPFEVAAVFDVDDKTPARWATEGKLRSLRTPGNHHRFYRSEVMAEFDKIKTKEEATAK